MRALALACGLAMAVLATPALSSPIATERIDAPRAALSPSASALENRTDNYRNFRYVADRSADRGSIMIARADIGDRPASGLLVSGTANAVRYGHNATTTNSTARTSRATRSALGDRPADGLFANPAMYAQNLRDATNAGRGSITT